MQPRQSGPWPCLNGHVLLLAATIAAGGLLLDRAAVMAQVQRGMSAPGIFSADLDIPFVGFDKAPVVPGMEPGDMAGGNRVQVLQALLAGRELPPNADGSPLTEQQQQAAKLLQQHVGVEQLPRSPGYVVQMLADRAAAGNAAEEPPGSETPEDGAGVEKIQRFYRQVVTSDWKAVKEYLAELPEDVGPRVYNHLLILLLPAVMLPDEIPLLADASPVELGEPQLEVLGQLLARSLARVGKPSTMLAAIAEGTERLGGSDPKRRLAAARVLIAAGMLAEAGPYLPKLEDVLREKNAELINLHARYQQMVGARKSDPQANRRAWELTQTVVNLPDVAQRPRSEALRRTLVLMPLMPEELVSAWLRKVFTDEPALGMRILAQVVQHVESSFAGKHYQLRLESLKVKRQVVNELLAAVEAGDEPWSTAIKMMMLGWLNEAQYTVGMHGQGFDHGAPESPESCEESGESGGHSASLAMMLAAHQGSEIRPLPPMLLFPLCPSESWCRAVDADMAQEVRRLSGKMAAIAGDREQTFAAIRHFATSEPKLAQRLAQRYVVAWLARLGGQDGDERQYLLAGHFGHGISSPYRSMPSGYGGRGESGIPLTRARQVRNLAAFADLLRAIEALHVPPLDAALLVSGLDACHSPAEVYRDEDLQRVFGNPDDLRPEITGRLVSAIRTKLARQWRMPEVQQQMNTRRTDQEHVAEVKRGYELAVRLAGGAMEKHPDRVELAALLAAVYFDQAEFLYGQKVDLQTYTAIRDRAFATYRQAARAYADLLPQLPPEKQSAGVFQQWFQSAMGASDLAYLTRQARPDRDQIEQIAAAIGDLGDGDLADGAADRHLGMFGKAISDSIDEVPPHLKPHYLREALRILGEHPSGEQARKLLRLYDELLGEIELHLAVDGPAEVGYGQPFGLRLSIRCTNALGRESGGFTSLLQKSHAASTGQEIDNQEKIEQIIQEKLGESFEIDAICFHDPNVTPRGFGRRGWRETPLAYLLVRSKDPSVDRIPVVHVDLAFSDGAGVVLLPVTSQVVLIDSRDPHPDLRPVSDVELKQVLDDRRLGQGPVRLEVIATAKGLIPDLDRLLDAGDGAVPGFAISDVEDHGLELASLDVAGDQVQPLCRRRWLVDLEPTGETAVEQFAFLRAKDLPAALAYQRYDDADIVDAAAVVPLRTGVAARRTWLWLGLGLGSLLLAVAVAMVCRFRLRRSQQADGPVYGRPDPLTPFSLLVLLRRIHGDLAPDLPAGERRDLAETIDDLEQQFFRAGAETSEAPDLGAVLDRWLRRTANGRTQTAHAS